LLYLLINKKGYVIETETLNKVHPELDKTVEDFSKNRLLEGAVYNFRFKLHKFIFLFNFQRVQTDGFNG